MNLTVLLCCLAFPALAGAQEPSSLDVRLFRNINARQSEGYGALEFIDQSSIPVFVAVPAGLLLWGILADNRHVLDTGVLTLAAQALTFGTTSGVKALVNRPRPFEALQNVKLKLYSSASGASFPSGHTSNSFAIATMVALRGKPAAYLPAFVWAGLIGYARIYVGVHYPSDVLGGMAIGIVLSYIVYQSRESLLTARDRLFGSASPSELSVPWISDNIPLAGIRIPL